MKETIDEIVRARATVDGGGEAGGVLVAEGEHGLMVVGVSDIEVVQL